MTDFPLDSWSGRDGSRLQIRTIRDTPEGPVISPR